MTDNERRQGPRTVVGYTQPAKGGSLAELLASTTPSNPRTWPLVVALTAGLFPLAYPLAVWAAMAYWRLQRSQWRWRWVSLVMLGLGLLNLVGFLAYGYGRYFTIR